MKPIYQKKFLHTYEMDLKVGSFHEVFDYIGIIFLIIVIFLFYLGLKNKINSLGYEIVKLEKVKKEFLENNEQLKLKVEKLRSLDRIESIARENLEMQIPDKIKIITYSMKE